MRDLLRRVGERLVALPRSGAWLFAVLWYALIGWLSSQPGSSEPGSALGGVLWNFAHAPLFGVLALALALLVRRSEGWPDLSPRFHGLLLAAILALGLADELHQHFLTPGRDASLFDVATDLAGATSALGLVRYLGAEHSEERGVWARIAGGLALCLAVATLATLVPRALPDVPGL